MILKWHVDAFHSFNDLDGQRTLSLAKKFFPKVRETDLSRMQEICALTDIAVAFAKTNRPSFCVFMLHSPEYDLACRRNLFRADAILRELVTRSGSRVHRVWI
ncbi:hypothetical protein ACRBEV_10835 [Methylobacterium phyllosphaerae]